MMNERFKEGDHIRVRRGLYYHHGIYISDDRVIDFSGGSLCAKYQASVRACTFQEFAGSDTAEIVCYPKPGLLGLALPPANASPRKEIVDRAEWLLRQPTAGRYNLLGSNCEHVASWCATGYYESLQVRQVFGSTGILALSYLATYKSLPAGLRNPRLIVTMGLVLMAGPIIYNVIPYLAWKKLLAQYPGYGNWQPSLIERGDNGPS